MAVTQRIRDVLERTLSSNLVGRDAELRLLLRSCDPGGAPVTWLHGVAGIGKSVLLQEFALRAGELGITVILADGHFIEPTPEGFLVEIGRLLNRQVMTIEAASEILGSFGSVVLIVDSYELFLLLDAWVRLTFIPALPDSVRVILSSRQPPGVGWRLPVEWQGLLRTMSLGLLPEMHTLQMLGRLGVRGVDAERIFRLTHGHPLAIRMAVSARSARPEVDFEGLAAHAVVQQLTRLYLADVTDRNTRFAIEAASVVRRTTRSLLSAMLPESGGPEQYDRLSALPFFEASREGLILQDSVQESVALSLRSSDPHQHDCYRRAALRQIRSEMRNASVQNMWRYTADLLYLVEAPFIRDAFFPAGAQRVAVEPACAGDGPAIARIAEEHESPAALQAILSWWRQAPDCFQAIRDASGNLDGFYILIDLRQHGVKIPAADKLALNWRRHMRDEPVAKTETAILVRRWLSVSAGEAPSVAQAACWLDVKRTFLQLKPRIQRCYITLTDPAPYAAAARLLELRAISTAATSFDGVRHQLLMLDFGPQSIDGWLGSIVARELRLEQDGILDVDARELILDHGRTSLTALESGVFRYLSEHQGVNVSRAELLQKVWGHSHDTGSNVVDVVVRSLRRKLGSRASMIATVRGVGYRLRSAT